MSKRERVSDAVFLMRIEVYEEQGGLCAACGAFVAFSEMELSHRIPQRAWCKALWGAAVIHHRRNLAGTHPGGCNSAVSLNPNSRQAVELAESIQRELRK